MSKRAEEDEFMDSFGKQYGYAGQIDEIRKQEFKRLEGNIVEWLYLYDRLHKLISVLDSGFGPIVLCSWLRHFTLTVPLSAQV